MGGRRRAWNDACTATGRHTQPARRPPITPPIFHDRLDAAQRLARAVTALGARDPVVLALPRGGVPVGHELARHLRAPLDVLVVRKLFVPGHEGVAMGALASGGVRVLHGRTLEQLGVDDDDVERVVARETRELARRERRYRDGRPPVPVAGRTAILVDDGLATGATLEAAADSLRERGPRRIVAAVPVGSPDGCVALGGRVDRMICLERPRAFGSIGRWYRDFAPTSDDEVRALLAPDRAAMAAPA
ncbi:MAG TPA: phosphoribosyltransferase family protein [Sandaracinaceae bacterium LLY-WYZ-13_1]|nr:phosphoribosyltransferase family protein [Sandaracinaceae bacterium LLY-WYZ-13_1]